MDTQKITVETTVAAPPATAWAAHTQGDHITGWNFASDDWHCPKAEVDLREGGRMTSQMEAKDGSMGFEFGGTFESVDPGRETVMRMDDGRVSRTTFEEVEGGTRVTTTFDAEHTHPIEMQRQGWQAILENYRIYTERLASD